MSFYTATFWKKNTQHLIENYELAKADNFKGWVCHHRLEEYYTSSELVMKGLYYNINPEALKYVRRDEHFKEKHKGLQMTDVKREKISETTKTAMKNVDKSKLSYWKGKHPHNHTEVQKNKMSVIGKKLKNKTWKVIDGKRVWMDKEEV